MRLALCGLTEPVAGTRLGRAGCPGARRRLGLAGGRCLGICISPKRLQRYVDEFSGRHGIRNRDTIDQMSTVVAGMVGKRYLTGSWWRDDS